MRNQRESLSAASLAALALTFIGSGVRPCAAGETGAAAGFEPAPSPQPQSQAPTAVASSNTMSSSNHLMSSSNEELHALDTRPFIAAMLGVSSDSLLFGMGLRGGDTLQNNLYIGGSLVYHFGETTTVGSTSVGASAFYIGPEVGYDFDIKPIVLRPYLGLGLAEWTTSVSGVVGNGARFVVWPGVSVDWNFPNTMFFVGGDMRFVSVPNGPAVGFFAFGGIHFGST